MADTTNLDTNEKVDILIKQSFGFPSTSENKQWYEETTVKFNNYLNGEELFLDVIPNIPDFDICGTVRLPEDVGLASSDFMNFNSNSSDKSTCSIVDDSTGTVRRYRLLILEQTPQLGDDAGASWYKLNSSSNNVVKDAFQFNFKQYKDEQGNVVQPYLYGLYTQKSTSSVLPFGRTGGNWNFDIRSGIIFFPDFNNFSNGTQTDSKFQINVTDNYPVLTFYKYIGRKGINLLNTQLNDVSNIVSQIIDGCYNIVGSDDASFAAFEASFNEYFDFGEALTIKKDVYISQNLYVDGSFTYINSSVQSIVDPIIELGADSCGNELSINDGQDRGLKLTYYDDSLNIQKSGFIGLINQESSDLYNTFALFSDACFNNNIVDLSESILGLLNLYGLNSEVINTNSLYNNNDLSLGQINLLDNSDNLVLNLKQINDLIDSKSFLTQQLFSNFIDNSYNLDLSNINIDLSAINVDISNLYQLINDISNTSVNIDLSNIDLSAINLDISNLYQLINDISNRSVNIDLSNIDLSAINLDISNLTQEILFLKNQDLILKSDINFNSALININKESINDNNNSINILNTLVNELVNSNILNDKNIKILNDQDNLLKSDINYLSSLINNNKIDVELLLSRVNDLENVDDEFKEDLTDILKIIPLLKDQDNLLKSDINYLSSLINNNKIDVELLLSRVNDLENVDDGFKEDLSDILKIIPLLKDQDNLLKSDINYLSSLINNNKIDVELLLSRVNDLENVDDGFKEDISDILKIIPLLKDQDNLLKSDINYLSSLINNNKIDVELLLSRVNDLENVDDEFKEDLTDILKIIPLLKDQDNLLKSDINYLSSLINNNKEEIKINKDSLEINRKNINVNTENISKIKNNLNNLEKFDLLLKSDINYNSSLINNLNQDNLINKDIINLLRNDTISLTSKIDYLLKIILNLSNQNNLSKEDINFNNSLINYNNVKLTSLEDFVDIINNNLKIFNQKFSDLEKKLQNAFDFL